MSKLKFSVAGLALVALTSADYSAAQQPQPGQTLPGQQAGQQPGQQQPGQQPGQQQTRQTPQAGQTQRQDQAGQGVSVREALARKFFKGNEGEIELARMAQEKADDQEIRQYTQMVIKDHEELNQQLAQFTGTRGESGQQRRQTPGADDQNRSNQDQERSQGTPGQPRPNQPGQNQPGQPAGAAQPGQAGQAGQAGQVRGAAGGTQANQVPEELVNISEKACEIKTQMTKEMLQEHQGQDFKMAYLGQQVIVHMATLAELQAIQSAGSQELRPLTDQATAKIQGHLEMAKQLAKKFQDDRSSSSQDRTSNTESGSGAEKKERR